MSEPVVLLFDGKRTFRDIDKRANAQVAGSGTEACKLLRQHGQRSIDELWLAHDLNDDVADVDGVVDLLDEAAFHDKPFKIGTIYLYGGNPDCIAKVERALVRRAYRVIQTDTSQLIETP